MSECTHTSVTDIEGDKPHYVYTLAYPDGKIFYVGKGFRWRINEHEAEARRGKSDNPHKMRTINKIWNAGEQVVKEKVGCFATHEEACLYEISLIFFMRPYGHLTNITDGGDGNVGLKFSHSEEAKQKIRESKKGQIISEEQREQISRTLKGRKLTEEHIRNRTEGQKGRTVSADVRAKMSASAEARGINPELWRKAVEARKGKPGGNLGRKFSEETRRKVSEAKKGITASEEARRNMSRAQKLRRTNEKQGRINLCK